MEPDDEKQKFQIFANQWWDKGGPFEPLKAMNSIRIPYILECLQKTKILKLSGGELPLEGVSILDVGCGAGFVSEDLAKLGGEVVGIDGVPELIEAAKHHASTSNINQKNLMYYAQNAEEFIETNSKKFDVVLILEVLDHVVDHEGFVEAALKCLRPGGAIFASTMNNGWMSWLFCKIIPEYILPYIPKGTHDPSKFIGLETTKNLLEINDCSIKDTKGYYYNYFQKHWFWWKTTSAWYIVYAIKC